MRTTLILKGKNGTDLTIRREGHGLAIIGPPGERQDEWLLSEQTYSDVMFQEPIDYRARVCAFATAELGKADLQKYWETAYGRYTSGGIGRLPWCGVFALYCLKSAGLTEANWIIGTGFVSPLKLKTVLPPMPGDIAYFSKKQHHAIVIESRQVLGDTMLTLCNGNGSGGIVTLSQLRLSAVTAFYSIQSLIDKAPIA